MSAEFGSNWAYSMCAEQLIVVNQRCPQHRGLAEGVEVSWAARSQVCLVHSWYKSVCVRACGQWLLSQCEAVWWDKIYLTSAKSGKSPNSFFFLIWAKFVCWKRGYADINPDVLGPTFKIFNSPESSCIGGKDILALDPAAPMENGELYLLKLVKKYCAGYRCFSHTPVLLSSN